LELRFFEPCERLVLLLPQVVEDFRGLATILEAAGRSAEGAAEGAAESAACDATRMSKTKNR
jgi:hypothetical protein